METSSIAIDSNSGAWHSRMPDLAVRVSQHDHIIGAPDAPVTLVHYGDYECATCSDFEPAVKALLGRHRRGIRFVFRHFPQNAIHPHASLAAQAAEAAGAQGKFWEMHDLLHHNRRHLAKAKITHLALAAGVEIYRFSAELARANTPGEFARISSVAFEAA